jgi:NADP-dependent 3-hydroxy acid dehydrogenase YdfG
MSNIQDKVVIITGASSGIGEATAKKSAFKGATYKSHPSVIKAISILKMVL